jgi:amidase
MFVPPVLPQGKARIVRTLPTPRQTHELPFGIQIIAPPGCEAMLFGFGRVVEEKLSFSHHRPLLI